MKNTIPLILAILLALAAVFAVSRMISHNQTAAEETISVIAATRDLEKGSILDKGFLMERVIPIRSYTERSITWDKKDTIIGQEVERFIKSGDFIFYSDIGLSHGISASIGEKEWAVSVSLAPCALTGMLRPGDEIAVIGRFVMKSREEPGMMSEKSDGEDELVTAVIIPRVRVIGVGSSDTVQGQSGEIIVALPPQLAQTLVEAQNRATLFPALRRSNDQSVLNRLDAGVVNEKTFDDLIKGLKTVQVKEVPLGKSQ